MCSLEILQISISHSTFYCVVRYIHLHMWLMFHWAFSYRDVCPGRLSSVSVSGLRCDLYTSVYYVLQSQRVATGYANNKIHKEAVTIGI